VKLPKIFILDFGLYTFVGLVLRISVIDSRFASGGRHEKISGGALSHIKIGKLYYFQLI